MTKEGTIVLSGFNLEPAEKAIVDNLMQNYKHKIQQRINFKEIKLRMKKSQHGKMFLHEVQGTLIGDKQFSSQTEDYNLFAAISAVLDNLMREALHSQSRKK